MEKERDYSQDIAEIRSMMERSSKFLSLSGLVGILIGAYSLVGAAVANWYLQFNPNELIDSGHGTIDSIIDHWKILLLALSVILLTIFTSVFFSQRRAQQRGEKFWSPAVRHLIFSLATPLVAGGILLLILLSHGLTGLLAPLSLLFYGLALLYAARFTFSELRILGLIQIVLGLFASYFIAQGLLIWAIGFGAVHIVYGIFMHYKYEK